MTSTENPFYVEAKGSRYAIMAVAYPTQERAEQAAIVMCNDASRVLVWDCTDSPRGTLRAAYSSGQKLEQCCGDWLTPCLRIKGHDGFHHPLGHGD